MFRRSMFSEQLELKDDLLSGCQELRELSRQNEAEFTREFIAELNRKYERLFMMTPRIT